MAKRSSINSFFGGVSNSPRERTRTGFASAKGFDIYTDPNRLIPLRRFVDDDNGAQATNITRFLRAKDVNSTALYGLGRQPGTERVELYKRTTDNVWAEEVEPVTGGITVNAMIEYKNNLYGGIGNNIWQYSDLDQVSRTMNVSYQTLTSPLTCQPILHPTSNILYFGYENKLASLDNTTFNATALVTIPDDYTIKDITPFGEFVAIACEPDNVSNPSYVYLWSQNTDGEFSAIYDIGAGKIGWLVELEGRLFVAKYTNQGIEDKITVADISSGELGVVKEIIDTSRGSLTTINPLSKYKENNVLYFGMDWAGYKSIWSFGRKTQEFPFILSESFQPGGTEGITSGQQIQHIYFDNTNWYCAYDQADSNVVRMDITSGGSTQYETNIYTSQINPSIDFADLSSDKQIIAIGVRTTPLIENASVEVEYSIDGGAFQTGFTHSTGTSTEATIQSGIYKEIQFKVKSIGGAEPVELYYSYETLNKLV